MELFWDVVRGLLPTIGVSALFGLAIWAIVRADAGERTERARLEAEEDAEAERRARGSGMGAGTTAEDPEDPS